MFQRNLCVCASVLMLGASVCQAVPPGQEIRKFVTVNVMRPESGGESVGKLIDSLRVILETNWFSTHVLRGQHLAGPEYLKANPSVDHVVAGILENTRGQVEANVYSQGRLSPHPLKSDSPDDLAALIVGYLKSDEVVLSRVTARQDPEGLSADDPDRRLAAYVNLGLYRYLGAKRYDEAIAAFSQASQIDEDTPVPLINLAICYREMGRFEEWQRCVERGLRIDPDNPDLRNHRAVLLMRDGNLDEAIEILEDLRSNDAIVQWNLAHAYSEKRDPQKFREHLERFVALSPDISMRDVAEERLNDLLGKERSLAITRRALWVTVVGLLCVGTIGLIVIVWHRTISRVARPTDLKPGDVLVLKVQIGMALLSGLFGILPLFLGRLLGG